ncbi:MAG: DUF262 domain-containing protein [Pseudomonadota bacterium]
MIGHPLKISDIMSEMSRGGIRIPEIQRDYVWRRSQIAKLLDSIYNRYPVGSILLWDTAADDIKIREMETSIGQGKTYDFIPKIILDGQQRITSLGKVFDSATVKGDRILFNVLDEVFEPYSPRHSSDAHWIDTTGLLTNEFTELDILDRLMDSGVVDKGNRELKNTLHDRLKKLSSIRDFQFPVEIVKEDDLEIITEIFIRVNSAGTRLREAELALARLAWKLPGSIIGPFREMEELCDDRGFDLDVRFFMRSLVSVATRQSRFKDLKAFWLRPAKDIEDAWKKTERGLKLALDFVEGNVGISGSAFLPSQVSLIPPCLIFAVRDRLSGEEERMLRRWLLIANAFSRYVGATESTLNRDLSILGNDCSNVQGLYETTVKDLRAEPRITPDDLDRSGTNNPFFFLSYLAVMGRDAVDWFKGIKIRRESFSEDQNIEYHHIFPKKLLNDKGVDRYMRDEMANIAFLSQKANRKILKRPPSDYLAEIAENDPARLEAQFIPMDRTLWAMERFDDFLKERRKLLSAAMNEVIHGG